MSPVSRRARSRAEMGKGAARRDLGCALFHIGRKPPIVTAATRKSASFKNLTDEPDVQDAHSLPPRQVRLARWAGRSRSSAGGQGPQGSAADGEMACRQRPQTNRSAGFDRPPHAGNLVAGSAAAGQGRQTRRLRDLRGAGRPHTRRDPRCRTFCGDASHCRTQSRHGRACRTDDG